MIEKQLAAPYLRHQGDRRAVPHPGRARDRYAARACWQQNGRPFPNLFAAGGAAVGVSGSQASGYLSGNGLLTATVFGRIAGTSAAKL